MLSHRSSNAVESFIARHAADPELSLERFVSEEGGLAAHERRSIEAYLRAARLLATLADSPRPPAAEGVDTGHRLLGTRLGEFELDDVIGRGGTGTVFKARSSAGESVAVKLLHPAFAAEPSRLARFRHEAATLRRVRHPSIVSVVGYGETEGLAFLAMELIDGESLDKLLARGALPRSNVLRARQTALVGVALADALHYAHEHGLVHRDVKPGNVLLHRSGHAYLLDFGFARDAAQSRLTGSDEMLGTPVYMAPEQRMPEIAPVDARTDVFGLGVTLFECIAGRHPYPATAMAAWERLTSVPGAPRALSAVLLKAIDPDHARRYPTAAELRDDLQRYLRGEPVNARQPGVVAWSRRLARRHPLILGASLAALAVVTALATVAGQRRSVMAAALGEARSLLAGNRPDDALRAFERAVEFGAADPGLAVAIDQARRAERAELAFDEVRFLVADPDATRADLARADGLCADVLSFRSHGDRFEPLMLRSCVAFLRGDLLAAVQHGSAAVQSRDVAVPPQLIAALAAFARNMLTQARGEDLLRQFLLGEQFFAPELDSLLQQVEAVRREQGQRVPESDPFFAVLLGAAGQPERALEVLDGAIERDPRNPNPLAILFKVLFLRSRGEPRLALEVVRHAIMASPRESAGLYALRARLQWELGDAAHALADATQALRVQPRLRSARLLAAQSLLALERPGEALPMADQVLADDPLHALAQHLKARAHARLGETAAAMAAAQTTLRIIGRSDLFVDVERREVLLDLLLWSSGARPAPESDTERRTRLEAFVDRCPPLLRCDDLDVRARFELAALHLHADEPERSQELLATTAMLMRQTAAEPPADAAPGLLKSQLLTTARWALGELESAPRFAALRARPEFAGLMAAWGETGRALGARSFFGDLLRGR